MNKTVHLVVGVILGCVSLFCGAFGGLCWAGSYFQFNVLVIFFGLLALATGYFALRSFARLFHYPPREQKPSVRISASETQHLTGATPDERLAPLVQKK